MPDFATEPLPRPVADARLAERMINSVEGLLPATLRRGDAETRRQSVLIVFAVLIANVVVPLAALLVWYAGHGDTALKFLIALVIHSSVLLLLLNGVSPRWVAQFLLACFFGEIAWDFGPDAGLGIMGVAVVPLVASGIAGSRTGLFWTAMTSGWCIAVGLQWVRPGDYLPGVAFTTALVAAVIGTGAWIMESMREAAVRKAKESRGLQLEAQDAMQRFLGVTFPAHVHTVGGTVTAVSPGVARLLDYTADDLLDRKLRALLHPEDQPLVERLGEGGSGESFHAEVRLWHKAGKWVWVEVFGVLAQHRDPGVRAEPWWFVARDIEQERQLRERQARAHRLEGLGVMAAGLAHDFNNLLQVIRGFAEMLPSSQERSSILDASAEAGSLAAHLMSFGRKTPARESQIDVASAIRKWSNMISRILGSTIRLDIEVPKGSVHAAIADGQLNQVLINLVTNAKDAMPEGGSLQIRLESIEFAAHMAEKLGLRHGRYARLAVIDGGHGMSREVLEQAVDPFFTTKAPGLGSGLGLATVYGIVKSVGGTLELESAPGEGTSVLVYLPQIDPSRRLPVPVDSRSAAGDVRNTEGATR
jgi:PAS domain S-box-containing protein